MPVDHARLTALFTEAIELDAAGQRRLLAGIEDAELRRELAEMLDADDHIVTALRTAGLKPTDFSGTFRRPPPEVPGYRLLHPLGTGGMGTVYAAEDAATNQQVAIKVLEVAADEALARFRAEAAIMEKLDHPNIARVLAAGDTRSRGRTS
jgi:serine/threonine-protein kinase